MNIWFITLTTLPASLLHRLVQFSFLRTHTLGGWKPIRLRRLQILRRRILRMHTRATVRWKRDLTKKREKSLAYDGLKEDRQGLTRGSSLSAGMKHFLTSTRRPLAEPHAFWCAVDVRLISAIPTRNRVCYQSTSTRSGTFFESDDLNRLFTTDLGDNRYVVLKSHSDVLVCVSDHLGVERCNDEL